MLYQLSYSCLELLLVASDLSINPTFPAGFGGRIRDAWYIAAGPSVYVRLRPSSTLESGMRPLIPGGCGDFGVL